jgi:hypothetical protein
MDCSYRSSASRYWASVRWRVARLRPALKIGTVTVGPNCQMREGPVKRSESATLSTPKKPVRLTCGKNAAFATPMAQRRRHVRCDGTAGGIQALTRSARADEARKVNGPGRLRHWVL